jgi:hypothetical protein
MAKSTLAFFLIGTSLFAAVPAVAQSKSFVLPFTDAHGVILLDIKVNERPAVLMLDTGTTTTLFASPGLIEIRLADHFVFAVRANDLGRLNNSNKKTMALLGISGILGQDFLHEFKSVRIDYAKHNLELEPK